MKYILYIWAFPVTIVGLTLNLILWLFGQVKFYRRVNLVLEWYVVNNSLYEKIFWNKRDGSVKWAGNTVGAIVTYHYKYKNVDFVMKHEHTHVRQIYRLGIFQPIIYGINIIAIWIGCPDNSAYYDIPFEIEARRVAGQLVDIGKKL